MTRQTVKFTPEHYPFLYRVCVQWVGSIDLANNDEADANILVAPDSSWTEQVYIVILYD
jgi:hypothetical protein